jgi:hypothetical protein
MSKVVIPTSFSFQNEPVPEIIDPVFAKTSQNARFLLSENERFGLVFVKTGSINSGTGIKGIIFHHSNIIDALFRNIRYSDFCNKYISFNFYF